ncbi:MAG: glycosyltransferase [Gammaproteobacteria bacterium]
MRVSGFTFIRNGTMLGYPFVESIVSALPLCDEFVVAVGLSEDDTLARVQAIADPKIRILSTQWNEQMRATGHVYAQQTMIAQFNCTGDWALYLQCDEVLHEDDLGAIGESMKRHQGDPRVEALVFDYYHFFGSPDWIAVSPGWYRREVRIIRNTIRSYSPSDGLFFVVMDRNKRGRYPRAALADGTIHHYGHVRSPAKMQAKIQKVSRYWGHEPPPFTHYAIDPSALRPFSSRHPAVMRRWLAEEAAQCYEPDPSHVPSRRERRHRLMMHVEDWLGVDLTRKHFKLVHG